MTASRTGLSNWTQILRALLLPGLLLVAAGAGAAPMRYELDLTPTATHAPDSWDHGVPVAFSLQSNCEGACHTGAAGDFAPSGKIDTPTRSGTFLLSAMKVRYYGDSANVKDYPDSVTGNTASAQGHYLTGGRATVTVPLARETFLHVRSVAVGQNACAIVASGGVECWGRGRFGGLGYGFDQDSNWPGPTDTFPTSVVQIAGYYRHSCALTADAAVWCWGYNTNGQLASNNSCPSQTSAGDCFNPDPSQVVGLPSLAASVTVGSTFSCARLLAGSVWCWGGDTKQSPAQVSGLDNVTEITAANGSACALRSDETVWCWGTNLQGPVQVSGLNHVTALSGSCALRSDTTVWCWYSGTPGQVAGLGSVASINSDDDSGGCAVRYEGTAWCWNTTLVPSRVAALNGVSAIARNDYGDDICAVRYDRTLWCWGSNGWGGLGNPVVAYSNSPVPVLSGASKYSDESPRVYTGSFDRMDGIFVATDNSHHSIGIGSGWPVSNSGGNANTQPPPFSPTYPGGILSDQYTCEPGNPYDDFGCGPNPSALDGYDLRSPLPSATGHKISNQDFPNDYPAKNGPLWLVGGGSIAIDPISPTDIEHASVGYTGQFVATALTPMARLTVSGSATSGTAAAVAFQGTFTLGAGGKAFAPATDDIVFGYGPYTAYLPAGTLQDEEAESGPSYVGQINGSPVRISVRHLRGGTYAYSIAAQSVDLSTLTAPANLDLYVGDNAASAPVVPGH